jgi:CubicO group peptidase (beta-lactamase class C family)
LQNGRYGHTGFTGTSVWIDPELRAARRPPVRARSGAPAARIHVLLTNRVHPCAAPIAMQRIRAEFMHLA